MRKWTLVALLSTLALPVGAWAFVKPLRVIWPQALGLHCSGEVCTDNPVRLVAARNLYSEALAQVQGRVGTLQASPRAVFCSDAACARAFGLGQRAAFTVGTLGILIAPRGWQPHYVRHELIHAWQSETLGNLPYRRLPEWLAEGMAYAWSDDPRGVLEQPFESYRERFVQWNGAQGTQQIAARLRAEVAR